ncbi:MAG: phasin family protein [Reyranellaceae bacterium]
MAYSAQETFAAFNPFKDMDVTKIMADMKFPVVGFDTVVEAQRKNIEALTAANQTALEGMQALFQRQAEVVRSSVEEMTKATTDLWSTVSPEEKAAKQAELVKKGYESAIANLREAIDMLAKTNTQAADLINKRVGESLDELKIAVAKK